jgi:hypothetical protein
MESINIRIVYPLLSSRDLKFPAAGFLRLQRFRRSEREHPCVSLIASRTSPNNMAVKMCEESGIVLIGYVRGTGGIIGYREQDLSTSSDGTRHVPSRLGEGTRWHGENQDVLNFSIDCSVKKIFRHRPFHGAKNRLQTVLPAAYNSSTIPRVCVQYAIGGGSRYREAPDRTEPPGS